MIISKYSSLKATKSEQNQDNIFYIIQVNDAYQIQTNLLVNDISIDHKNRYNIISRKLVSTKQWTQEDVQVWGS